jgi:hypothetical protein
MKHLSPTMRKLGATAGMALAGVLAVVSNGPEGIAAAAVICVLLLIAREWARRHGLAQVPVWVSAKKEAANRRRI